MSKIAVVVEGETIMMDVTSYVKWENRAMKVGKKIEEVLSDFLCGR